MVTAVCAQVCQFLTDGLLLGAAADSLVATYNDLPSVERLFETHAGAVACVIVEPMIGNHGALAPSLAFLQAMPKTLRSPLQCR